MPESSANPEDFQEMLQTALAAAMGPVNQKLDTVSKELADLRDTQVPQGSSDKARIIRDARAKAVESMRAAFDEQQISYDDNDLSLGASGERMKKDDLGEFDGSDVYTFKAEVDSALSMFSTESVARMMARNLKGRAHSWWISLDAVIRDGLLKDADTFFSKLNNEFAKSKGTLRTEALMRKWQAGKEPVMDYYYDKVKLLTNSFGNQLDQADLCHEIREGLPDDFKVLIRTTMAKNARTEALRTELHTLEPDYLDLKKKSSYSPSSQRNPGLPSQPPPSRGRPSNPAKGAQQERPRSLRETYNPKNILYKPDPNDSSKRVRTYY